MQPRKSRKNLFIENKNMINPEDIKVGAQFRTRGGRIATVQNHDPSDDILPWHLRDNADYLFWVTPWGFYNFNEEHHPDDLIELIQPNTMNKTYYCKVTNPNLSKFIADTATAAGKNSYPNTVQTGTIFIGEDGMIDSYSGGGIRSRHNPTEVTIEEFLALLEKPKTISVKLNNQYTAEISKDSVKVGCQSFEYSKIEEIVAAHQKLNS